jgi:hypothetical protein
MNTQQPGDAGLFAEVRPLNASVKNRRRGRTRRNRGQTTISALGMNTR